MEALKQIVFVILTVIIVRELLRQCRKPRGWLGRFFLWAMNDSHSRVTNWGLAHVSIEKNDTILDIGCGGGRTVQKLAAIATAGKVYGVDYSLSSVAASRRTNRELIKTGGVEIQHGSVSHLPFSDSMFDLITAVETHYYWPDPVADLQEVLRVLKPGGRLIIIAEAYKGGRYDQVFRILMKPIRAAHLSVDEHRELFSMAGYSEPQVFEEYKKGWICGVARRPSSV
jgi:ubiquinone/menaquinone biosynthesis C-methylase UbiE